MNSELVREYFEYRDGGLYWKKPRKGITNGSRFGWQEPGRYRGGTVDRKRQYEHRMIFAYFHGYWPETVDHVDGDTTNNRIENLRPATQGQNIMNSRLQARNKLGVKGVRKQGNVYSARIAYKGKEIYLGCFADLELAELVSTEARDLYFGDFARHK
jgi:hypothetical protein